MIKIKTGTPTFFKSSPCASCQNAVIIRGAAESEIITKCYEINREIPFIVKECTGYLDKNNQTVRQMESIAWLLNVNKQNKMGFTPPTPKDKIKPYIDYE